jgi:uncharacterized protein (TIGR02646 family)
VKALVKLQEPSILLERGDEWTEAYVSAIEEGRRDPPERWRHPGIKKTLSEELQGRCAYCESYLEDVSYPHVEHIVPKSLQPELSHHWPNLTSACARCNVAKGDFYHPTDGLLDPYRDDIDGHLVFLGGLVSWLPGSVKGELTIKQLGLNRTELSVARNRRLEDVREMLERWHGAGEPLRTAIADAIRLDVQLGEFSCSVTALLSSFSFPLDDDSSSAPD